MKISFWRFKGDLISCAIILSVISIILSVTGVVFIRDYDNTAGIILICVNLLIILLFVGTMLLGKKYLSKITFSNNGFEITRFKKCLISYDWGDITDIKTTPYAKGFGNYLCFVIGDNKLDIQLTKKMYDTIMILCPYAGIKTMINNIGQFYYFHKNKK